MSAILIKVVDKKISVQNFDTVPEARIEMEEQFYKASYDGEIVESQLLEDEAWVEDGRDCKDYLWKIEWI